jgi:thymidylate synthase (FAD)
MGSDLSVVNAARVSFEKESDWDPDESVNKLNDGDRKLINYLAKHKHFSPFNHAFMSFRVKAPIFVARQLVKHKFMPWNEVSRRYVDSEPEFFIPQSLRGKAANVKQGSTDEANIDNAILLRTTAEALGYYQDLLDQGVCPEQARMALPANTHTEWIWSGSLGAFADMLHLRLDPHSQKESRDVAELIYAQALPLFPVSLKALLESK